MMPLNNLKYYYAKSMSGLAAVEFTILMAFVFAPMVLGTIEIGRIFFEYNNLAKSVRNGAKYISLFSPTQPSYGTQVAKAQCLAAFGNMGCAGNPIVPGLTVSKITIVTSSAGSPGTVAIKLVSVTATGYQLSYITNFFVGGAKAFNDISVTMRQATS